MQGTFRPKHQFWFPSQKQKKICSSMVGKGSPFIKRCLQLSCGTLNDLQTFPIQWAILICLLSNPMHQKELLFLVCRKSFSHQILDLIYKTLLLLKFIKIPSKIIFFSVQVDKWSWTLNMWLTVEKLFYYLVILWWNIISLSRAQTLSIPLSDYACEWQGNPDRECHKIRTENQMTRVNFP